MRQIINVTLMRGSDKTAKILKKWKMSKNKQKFMKTRIINAKKPLFKFKNSKKDHNIVHSKIMHPLV